VGGPGIGKSAVVRQVAKLLALEQRDTRILGDTA
jgi:MoxR-like ATPase